MNFDEAFQVERLPLVVQRTPCDPSEAGGVLNPAVARAPDGQLYIFPRLVAAGNFSRIGMARVVFRAQGDPVEVQRLGIVLSPEAKYERNALTGGGVEDPRITYLAPLRRYVMSYTAFSAAGPRIALAISEDLFTWRRLGLVRFAPGRIDFNGVSNKDGVLFPELVPGPDGQPSLALIHRPLLPGTKPTDAIGRQRIQHESLWISYCPLPGPEGPWQFGGHRRLLSPLAHWERIKVGAGAPPVRTPSGWLLVYHGVGGSLKRGRFHYSAGAAILDPADPSRVLWRSSRPILAPGERERAGVVPDVVFPTGLDQRLDLGQSNRFDLYFGMADDRIGVARLRFANEAEIRLDRSDHRAA